MSASHRSLSSSDSSATHASDCQVVWRTFIVTQRKPSPTTHSSRQILWIPSSPQSATNDSAPGTDRRCDRQLLRANIWWRVPMFVGSLQGRLRNPFTMLRDGRARLGRCSSSVHIESLTRLSPPPPTLLAKICPKALIPCIFASNGCIVTVERCTMSTHMRSCLANTLQCSICDETLPSFAMNEHLQMHDTASGILEPPQCPQRVAGCFYYDFEGGSHTSNHLRHCASYIVSCQYCFEPVSRAQIAAHLNVHASQDLVKSFECPLKYLGCEFSSTKDKLLRHLEACEKYSISCPGCQTVLLRNDWDAHAATCKDRKQLVMPDRAAPPSQSSFV
eukprot:m.233093 g.233093  ORF g.233093 m.233093 type:complete len:333 (-) comp10875_c0_seq133:1360-2358(-)